MVHLVSLRLFFPVPWSIARGKLVGSWEPTDFSMPPSMVAFDRLCANPGHRGWRRLTPVGDGARISCAVSLPHFLSPLRGPAPPPFSHPSELEPRIRAGLIFCYPISERMRGDVSLASSSLICPCLVEQQRQGHFCPASEAACLCASAPLVRAIEVSRIMLPLAAAI
jgi:hypothetical protein